MTWMLRERAIAEPTEAEADFALLDAAPLATTVHDPQGHCIYANEAWERMWSLPRAVALRQNILQDASTIDRSEAATARRAFAGERVVLPPVERDLPAGRRRIRTHLAPFATRRGTFVIARYEDVTERFESSEEMLALRALGEMGLGLVTAVDGRIVWANAAYEALTGYSLAELASPDFDVLLLSPGRTPDDARRNVSERVAGLRVEERYTTRIRRKDGTLVDVEVQLRTIERGPPLRVVALLRAL